jgi:trimethylamine--corrinoid protein Co-methyltransferase
MKSDFIYPDLADRQAPDAWLANGAPTINDTARQSAKEKLTKHFPSHIPLDIDQSIRTRFDIKLPRERMCQV